MLLWLVLACNAPTDKGEDSQSDTSTDTSTDTAGDTASDDTGEVGETETFAATRLESSITWTLTFDETAQANGFTDCSYHRDYTGLQYLDADYLCPDCSVQVGGTAVMTDGLDCYAQITGGEVVEERYEAWGVSDDHRLFRMGVENYSLGELTTFEAPVEDGAEVAVSWDGGGTLTDGGELVLMATGTMRYAVDEETLLDDPWAPRGGPGSCGWERNNPGTLELDYTLAIGSTFPNVRLDDQCGDPTEIWDFYGSYLILDSSQEDCGPCQNMAEQAPAFIAEMAAEGISVRLVSLMGDGLSNVIGTPSDATIDEWVEAFDLEDPVLADKGFAYALFPPFLGADSFGFPAWIVVDPEMKLLNGTVGFTSWDTAAEWIRADVGR